MAIIAAAFGVLGRFVGKLLTALGWANTPLVGRVPQRADPGGGARRAR
jgi:hypothetical protein